MLPIALCLLLAGCKNGPRVTACIVDCDDRAKICQCDCSNSSGQDFVIPIEKCSSFVAMPPTDAERMLKYCRMK